MAVHRRSLSMSAPPFSRLPRLDSDLERHILIRPERRQATAKLRRQWLESKQETKPEECTHPNRGQGLPFRSCLHTKRIPLKPLHNHVNSMKIEQNTETQNRNGADIAKRNLVERLPFFQSIRISTAPRPEPLTDRACAVMPMFHVARATLHKDKERNRMHFISSDWSSENVSWKRFKSVSDFHQRSWIE